MPTVHALRAVQMAMLACYAGLCNYFQYILTNFPGFYPAYNLSPRVVVHIQYSYGVGKSLG